MTIDWKPKAPSVRKAFQRTKQEKASDHSARHGPVTKSELTKLESQRERPQTGRALAPDDAKQRQSDIVSRQREDRAKHIQHRLRRMKNRARDDFDRSR